MSAPPHISRNINLYHEQNIPGANFLRKEQQTRHEYISEGRSSYDQGVVKFTQKPDLVNLLLGKKVDDSVLDKYHVCAGAYKTGFCPALMKMPPNYIPGERETSLPGSQKPLARIKELLGIDFAVFELLQSLGFIVAGGAILGDLTSQWFSDVDLFQVLEGPDRELPSHERKELGKSRTMRAIALLVQELHSDQTSIYIMDTKQAITLQVHHLPTGRSYEIQIIKRIYRSPAEVILSFDVAPCRLAYGREGYYATESAVFALANGFYPLEPDTLTFSSRYLKYRKKGFAVLIPRLEEINQILNYIEEKKFAIDCTILSMQNNKKDELQKYPMFMLLYSIIMRPLFSMRSFNRDEPLAEQHETTVSGSTFVKKGSKKITLRTLVQMDQETREKILDTWDSYGFYYRLEPLEPNTVRSVLNQDGDRLMQNWKIDVPMERMFNVTFQTRDFYRVLPPMEM